MVALGGGSFCACGSGYIHDHAQPFPRNRCDIRSSEKVFWRKVLDIYTTSIDYDPSTEASRQFFATIQNKMHWASHGQTAAEVIYSRADATRPHMGMTSWTGDVPSRTDAEVAKNYLNQQELDILNRIVSSYLEFAELQALSRKHLKQTKKK